MALPLDSAKELLTRFWPRWGPRPKIKKHQQRTLFRLRGQLEIPPPLYRYVFLPWRLESVPSCGTVSKDRVKSNERERSSRSWRSGGGSRCEFSHAPSVEDAEVRWDGPANTMRFQHNRGRRAIGAVIRQLFIFVQRGTSRVSIFYASLISHLFWLPPCKGWPSKLVSFHVVMQSCTASSCLNGWIILP